MLCSKYREGKKTNTRTVANLSHLSDQLILSIENALKSERETIVLLKDISVKHCIDYGYILVTLHTMKQLRIDEVLEKNSSGGRRSSGQSHGSLPASTTQRLSGDKLPENGSPKTGEHTLTRTDICLFGCTDF